MNRRTIRRISRLRNLCKQLEPNRADLNQLRNLIEKKVRALHPQSSRVEVIFTLFRHDLVSYKRFLAICSNELESVDAKEFLPCKATWSWFWRLHKCKYLRIGSKKVWSRACLGGLKHLQKFLACTGWEETGGMSYDVCMDMTRTLSKMEANGKASWISIAICIRNLWYAC